MQIGVKLKENNYFVLNKAGDYQRGIMGNICYRENKLIISGKEQGEKYFVSEVYDSCEAGLIWHRMKINCKVSRHELTILVYASDDASQVRDILHDWKNTCRNSDILHNRENTCQYFKDKFKKYCMVNRTGSTDILLHEVKGRYVWFILEFSPKLGHTMEVSEIRLYFPKDTWLRYLPEVYQQDTSSARFLEGFLSIFQSLYEDLNEEIQASFAHFQPYACKKEYLRELAEWIHVENSYIWKEEQLRNLLANSMKRYAYRGTVQSLLEEAELYTGERVYVIEQHKLSVERKGRRRKLINALYGTNCYSFCLLVKEEHIPTEKEYRAFMDIIKAQIPARMECKIIVLRPYIFLDKHTYMGMNSVMARYQPFDFSKNIVLPLCSLEGNR